MQTKAERREAAAKRAKEREARSPKQQLARLDRLGLTAAKERKRLMRMLRKEEEVLRTKEKALLDAPPSQSTQDWVDGKSYLPDNSEGEVK
jgi:hypothetical protein